MKTINQEDFTKSLAILFKETFEGMVAPDENIFTDKESSFFSTIGKIDAAKASAEKNQTTIAAHSEHARFYIELLDNYLNKNFHVVDFNRSWNVKSVTEDEWDLLRENISKIYRKVCETFEANEEWTLDTITVAMGILAHTAYHLGAIRQIVKEN
jgi:hypothetical protein